MDKRATDYLVQAITASTSSQSVDSPNLSSSSPPSESPTSKESTEPSASSQQLPPYTTATIQDAGGLGIQDESGSESDSRESEEAYLDESDSEEDEGGEPLFAGADLLQDGVGNEAGSMISVRLENCGLRGQALESLGEYSSSSQMRLEILTMAIHSSRCTSINVEAHLDPTKSNHCDWSSRSRHHDP